MILQVSFPAEGPRFPVSLSFAILRWFGGFSSMKQNGQITTKHLPDIIMRGRIEWGLHSYWEFSQSFKGFTSDYAYTVDKGFFWFFLLQNAFFRESKGKTLYYIIYGSDLKRNCNQLPSVVHKSFVYLLSFCFGQKMFPKFWFFLIQC